MLRILAGWEQHSQRLGLQGWGWNWVAMESWWLPDDVDKTGLTLPLGQGLGGTSVQPPRALASIQGSPY